MSLPPYVPPKATAVVNFHNPVSWGIRDPERFNALLREAASLVAPGYHLGDNVFTWCRNNSFADDPAFRTAFESNVMNEADGAIVWRRYFLATMAHHAVQLPGDFVECGVYWGSGVKTVMDYLGGKTFPKTFWAYDTFDSNPVEGHAFPGQEAGFYEKVAARFAGYEQLRLVKGFIPDAFTDQSPTQIAYLHIDLNNAPAEIATLDALFDRVVSGGVIIFDDYEWAGVYRPQKLAEDPWLAARGYRVVPLPTGQGFVIKR